MADDSLLHLTYTTHKSVQEPHLDVFFFNSNLLYITNRKTITSRLPKEGFMSFVKKSRTIKKPATQVIAFLKYYQNSNSLFVFNVSTMLYDIIRHSRVLTAKESHNFSNQASNKFLLFWRTVDCQ